MSSVKRKVPPTSLLQRRVRPRYEPEPESDLEDDDATEAPSDEEAGSLGSDAEEEEEDGSEDESGSGSDEGDSAEGSGGESDEEGDEPPHIDASQLSFGALAKAQAAMGSSRRQRRGTAAQETVDDDTKSSLGARYDRDTKEKKSKPEKTKRSSKHAPAEMASNKPVSRARDFLTVTAETSKRPPARDPRFMPLGPGAGAASSASKIDEIKARKAYAFLDEYRASEMAELRAAIKKTKDAAQREQLQRALLSMESRAKAQARKDKEREVIEEHRRREKELVRQGKTPFYLKRSEQKKRLLVDQFQGMKKKQVDRAIERRRKKVAAREKKLLPVARRGAEDR